MITTARTIDDVLAHPFDREWSIQGLGMLRTYLDEEHVVRLHIWDTDQAVDDVSTIHDHPWDFTSRIVRGDLTNQRYFVDVSNGDEKYSMARIRCGEGGGLVSAPSTVRIAACSPERYERDETYAMLASEFHESFPSRGAVTIIERSFHADRDIATVCWRSGGWVSAEPRPATRTEIEHFVSLAKAAG